ncbi:MAG: hypothetical protein K2M73_08015 [Lachnospiraceae bacterium]|nr:hypothetical protein [Lachnospiraceae bacterium]
MYVVLFLLYLSDISLRLQACADKAFEGIITLALALLLVAAFVAFIKCATPKGEESRTTHFETFLSKIIKSKLLALCIVLLLIMKLFTPSDKMLQIIAGLYAGILIVEQPAVNSLLDKSYKLIDSKLNKLLEESGIELLPGENANK